MIDLDFEKNKKMSSQDMYDIMSFTVQAADDNGFVNIFILNRALYLFSAIILYPEKKEELSPRVAENINTAWDYAVEEGIIETMSKEYSKELEVLAEYTKTWCEDFTAYAHSVRGLLDTFSQYTGDVVSAAAETYQKMSQNAEIQNVLDLADKWGMNNPLPQVDKSESLFEK